MRPRDRLLRKGINPNEENAIRRALEEWSDRLSLWEHIFTGAVVVGLIIEYLAEITSVFSVAIATALRAHDLQLREWGGLFVILGVAGELAIGLQSSRVETGLREESNSVLAQASERAANAERQAAEANLARVKIEERLLELSSGRKIQDKTRELLQNLLEPLKGNRVDIFLFDEHGLEAKIFADQLNSIFRSAEWEPRVWHCSSGRKGIGSLTIAVAAEEYVREGSISPLQNTAGEIAHRLHRDGIEITMLGSGFDRATPVEPWEMKEHALWKPELAASLRIEVSPLQHIPLRNQFS